MQLPEEILSYVLNSGYEINKPAFVKANSTGKILLFGGELSHYGFNSKEIDTILELHDLFEGYFPLSENNLLLPMVELNNSKIADIHIFSIGEDNWILISDKTSSESNFRDFLQQRNDEKLISDKEHKFEEDPIVFELLSQSGILILKKDNNQTFHPIGKIPKWANYFISDLKNGLNKDELCEKFPFLEFFMNLADDFWDNNNKGKIESEIWNEELPNSKKIFLEATALSINNKKILQISNSDKLAKEKSELMQRARELTLEQELRIKAENALYIKNEELEELNATKDKFFSIIAHDLRNPISAFRNVIDTFSNYYDKMDEESVLKNIKILDNQSTNIIRLLENLLQWGKTQMNSVDFIPYEIEISTLVDSIITMIKSNADEKNIHISNRIPNKIVAECDENLIAFVLRNLISNAIKFTPRGGRVLIKGEEFGQHIKITVSDSGIGIRQEDLNKLFKIDIHYTTSGTEKEQGTGLGLILCKEFIDLHSGSITVDSEYGKGSDFHIILPKKQSLL